MNCSLFSMNYWLLRCSPLPLQRAHQTSTRTATFWSSGLATPTSRRSPYVKPPSIVPNLASTAAATAACLSSAGPCPSPPSCLCRVGHSWPPDPLLPHALCLSGKAFASLLGGRAMFSLSLSLCLSETALTEGGLWLLCVLVGSLLLCLSCYLSLSLSPLWSIVL